MRTTAKYKNWPPQQTLKLTHWLFSGLFLYIVVASAFNEILL